MSRPTDNSFVTIAGVSTNYARLPVANYGTRGRNYRFYATAEFERKLDRCFFELWDVCPYGKAEVITSAGAWVGKSSYHGRARAFDLDGIFWTNRTFVTLQDGYNNGDRPFYFGVEAILRRHFGTVLDYLYNAPHRDHFHIDDGSSVGFNSSFRSTVSFLQGTLVYVFGISVGASGIDGLWGRNTRAALNQALSRLGITGSISNQAVWLQFLSGVARTAFGTENISPREFTVLSPVNKQEFSSSESIEFRVTGTNNIKTLKVISDDSQITAEPESAGAWIACLDQTLRFGEKTFQIRGFDDENRLVTESLIDVLIRRNSPEDYKLPEGAVNLLGGIQNLLDGASQINSPFIDCKIMLELAGGQIYVDSELTVTFDGNLRSPKEDTCCGLTTTLLRYPNAVGQEQYVDAEEIPYIALPDGYEELGIFLGDIVAIIFNGKVEFAVFANVSRCSQKLLSGSVALMRSLLQLNENQFTGDISLTGIPEDVGCIIFPGSGDGTPQSPEAIRHQGKLLLKQLGGQLPEDITATENYRQEEHQLFLELAEQSHSLDVTEEYLIRETLHKLAQTELKIHPEGQPEITNTDFSTEAFSSDIDILARTIYGEARGESDQGKAAVAWTVINRVNFAQNRGGYWWGNSIRRVCLKPWQYSCWNRNDPNRNVILNVTASNSIFARCLEIAEDVIARRSSTPVDGATHYYADYISPPSWAHSGTFVIKIGVHLFYKDIP